MSAPGVDTCGDDGFSILETVLALSLFALIVVGVMTSVGSGLRITSRSNGRQLATQAAVRAIELYRTYDFTAVGMDSATAYEPGPTSPDANVSAGPPRTFTPPLVNGATEVMVEGGSVTHIDDNAAGGRTVRTYRYVTWTDASKTEKRLTVIARYQDKDNSTGLPNQVVMSSVFSRGQIDWPLTLLSAPIPPHTVGQTVVFSVTNPSGFPSSPTFYVVIESERYTVTVVTGSSWTALAGGTAAHAAGSAVELASGGVGSPAPPTTAPSSTTTTMPPSTTSTAPPSGCAGDATPPAVSKFQILKGASAGTGGFTNSNTLTLSVTATDGCVPLTMQINTTGVFGAGDPWVAYSPSPTATTSGDGSKTVYGRFRDGNNNVSGISSDSVVVDTINPSPVPALFKAVRVDNKGNPSSNGKVVKLSWNNSTTDANMDSYTVFRRTGATAAFITLSLPISCGGSFGSNAPCTATDGGLGPSTGYTYYVVGVDKAGNQSGETTRVSV